MRASLGFEEFGEPALGSAEQSGHGRLAAAQTGGDRGDGPAEQAMPDERVTLVDGQLLDGVGQTGQLFVPLRFIGGRRPSVGQEVFSQQTLLR
jgi:hypothetical protein